MLESARITSFPNPNCQASDICHCLVPVTWNKVSFVGILEIWTELKGISSFPSKQKHSKAPSHYKEQYTKQTLSIKGFEALVVCWKVVLYCFGTPSMQRGGSHPSQTPLFVASSATGICANHFICESYSLIFRCMSLLGVGGMESGALRRHFRIWGQLTDFSLFSSKQHLFEASIHSEELYTKLFACIKGFEALVECW